MSKTSNYQLTLWDWEDEERLEEINENFAKLDGATPLVVMGSYLGEKSAELSDIHSIELGFRPRIVFVLSREGRVDSGGSNMLIGLFGDGLPQASNRAPEVWAAHVTDTGFEIRNKNSILLNFAGYTFYYWALR